MDVSGRQNDLVIKILQNTICVLQKTIIIQFWKRGVNGDTSFFVLTIPFTLKDFYNKEKAICWLKTAHMSISINAP